MAVGSVHSRVVDLPALCFLLHAVFEGFARSAGARCFVYLRWRITGVEGPEMYGKSSVGCIRSSGLKLEISANRLTSRLCEG